MERRRRIDDRGISVPASPRLRVPASLFASGSVLLFSLVILGAVLASVLLLAQAAAVRLRAQHTGMARETALRVAEDALEQARWALEAGQLNPDEKLQTAAGEVVCRQNVGKASLEILAVCAADGSGKVRAPALRLIRGVRVTWELARGSDGRWHRTLWRARDETLKP